MVQIAKMKLSQFQREAAVKLTLDYLEGPQFTNSMEAVIGETIEVYRDLKDEIKRHYSTWKKRYKSYATKHEEASVVKDTTKAVLSGEEEYKNLVPLPSFPAWVELPVLA